MNPLASFPLNNNIQRVARRQCTCKVECTSGVGCVAWNGIWGWCVVRVMWWRDWGVGGGASHNTSYHINITHNNTFAMYCTLEVHVCTFVWGGLNTFTAQCAFLDSHVIHTHSMYNVHVRVKGGVPASQAIGAIWRQAATIHCTVFVAPARWHSVRKVNANQPARSRNGGCSLAILVECRTFDS